MSIERHRSESNSDPPEFADDEWNEQTLESAITEYEEWLKDQDQNKVTTGEDYSVHSVPLGTLCSEGVHSVVLSENVLATLPTSDLWGVKQRRPVLGRLARALKAEYPKASVDELDAILRKWHGLATLDISYDKMRMEFRPMWNGVIFAKGESPTEKLMQSSIDEYDPPAMALDRYQDSLPLRLATICARLQEDAGDGVQFFLSSRMGANALGILKNFPAVNDCINEFIAIGWLVETEPYTHWKARRFVWTGGMAKPKRAS